MPTSASSTFSNTTVDPYINPEDAMESMLDVKFKASSTIAAGTVVGEITASPGTYGAYASGNVDGTQTPAGITRRTVVTDGSSNITNFSEWGNLELVAAIFLHGDFLVADLTGLDANAITKLGGKVSGNTAATQIFSF